MTEVIVVVTVVGVLAATAVAMVSSGAIQGAREVRATQDQKVLNSAVLAYLSSGGDLAGAKGAVEVLAQLRTSATPEQQRRIPGLSGSFLDPSVEFVVQTKEEAKKKSPRLHWNPSTSRFDVAVTGDPGIVSVSIRSGSGVKQNLEQASGGDGAEPQESYEHRRTPFVYADKSTWVWDYADAPVTFPSGPSEFVTSDPSDTVLPYTPPAPPPVTVPPVVPPVAPPPAVPPTPVNRTPLAAPQFSLPAGRYPSKNFNLSLALHDRNPAGAAALFYSLNHGVWVPYGGSISVPPDSSVKAQAMPVNAAERDPSAVVEAVYEAQPALFAMLLPPLIDFNKSHFQNSADTIAVRLTNPNLPGSSALRYQLVPVPNGGGPTTAYLDYAAPFVVRAQDYPSGFGVRAVAVATAPGYLDSRPASRFATAQTTLFGGHLDLDTSTSIAKVGSGATNAHSHDILKAGGTSISFFAIPDSNQVEIQEAVKNASQRFRLTVVNGALSPGMNLFLEYELGGEVKTLDVPVDLYGALSVGELPVFSLGGVSGSARLRGLRFTMAQDLIYQAGIVPTNTGEVVSNVPGKSNEWRNGALTLQAVAVNANGSAAFSLDPSRSNGSHGAATSGLLWEAAVFWHWSGESYQSNRNTYKPKNFNSIRLFVENNSGGKGKGKGP